MDFKTFDPEQLDLSKLNKNDSNKRKEIKEMLLNLIKEGESVIKKSEQKLPSVLKTPQPKLHTIREIDMFKAPQPKIVVKSSPQQGTRIGGQIKKSSTVVRAQCKEIQQKLQLRGLKIEKIVEKPIERKQLIRPVRIETIRKNQEQQKLTGSNFILPTVIKTYTRSKGAGQLHKLQASSVTIKKVKNSNQSIGVKCMICKKMFKDLKQLGEHSKQDCDHRNVVFKTVDQQNVPFEHIVIKSEFIEGAEPKVLQKIPFKENVKKLENGQYLCLKCKFISKNNHFALAHLLKHINGPPQKPDIPVSAPIISEPVLEKLPTTSEIDFLNALNTPVISTKFYQCDQCPKAFISCILLFEHKQRNHKIKEEVLSDLEESNETDFYGFPEMFCDPVFDSVIDAVPKNLSIKLDEWLDTDSNSFLPPPVKIKRFKKPKPKTFKVLKLSKGIKQFKCIICNEGFAKQFELSNHILKDHESVPTFKCEICEKILLSQTSLDTHKSLLHKFTKKLFCDKCENVFFLKQEQFDDHMLFQHGYKCTQCDIRPFKVQRLLDNHLFKHHGGENCNKCEICGKLFQDFSHVKRHIQSVHENYRPKTCSICGKNFKDIDMNRHMRIHSGERPFPCDVCDSTFRFNQDLIVHKRLHTGERPYECTICLMRFIANTNLNKHLKARHPVEPDSLDKLLN